MLADSPNAAVDETLFASWPLQPAADLHTKHRGRAQTTAGARATTLDDYLAEHRIAGVGFVKIDVDGSECRVLGGGIAMLRTDRPTMVMELSPYLLEETGHSVEALLELLGSAGYYLADLTSGRALPMNGSRSRARIPDGASINVVARPTRSHPPRSIKAKAIAGDGPDALRSG
jgi:hypothetical protein